MYDNLQDKPFLQPLQSLIDSKEKESSLSKFVSWELPWRHLQKQYEKIGDLSRSCASAIYSLSTYLTTKYSTENLHFSTQLQKTCTEMGSESAKALAQLSLSIKHKTSPAASTYIHLTTALNLASHLENTLEANDMTSRLVESLMIIEKLVSSIEELAGLVSFKQFEQYGIVSELVTRFIPAIEEEVATRTNQFVAYMKKFVYGLFTLQKKS
ncbi:aluminum-activated malate transporter 1-like protein [Carex littledalei]|uniref:Aluminum-activated malate transporter 1-like protein n=1 Tax=Carex littledalei TaxID=544730 RepID=A0A833RBJ8_9POAL|nr:aluminum-activated malate transporter 1-like protein [Carex littledalei]